MANEQARFTINGTPSADPVTGDRQYTAIHDEELTITLEANPSQALSATFEVFDATNDESPFASKNAPLITWNENSNASITVGVVPFGINDDVTIDMPSAVAPPNPNIHSYVIRCTVSTPGDGSPLSQEQVFEREVLLFSLATTPGIRKTVPGETTQARARAWSDSLNDLIDAMENLSLSGGGTLQQAYVLGNTIDVTLGNGPVLLRSTIAVTQSPLTVQMDAVNVIEVDIVGAVSIDPISGQDFDVTTLGAGAVNVNSATTVDITAVTLLTLDGADVDLTATAGDVTIASSGGALVNAYTFPTILVDTFSLPNAQGAAASVLTDLLGDGVLSFEPGAAATTLQIAYDNGQTIDMLAATGDLVIDATDAVAFSVQKGASNVIDMSVAGAVTLSPPTGQDVTLTTLGGGNAVINTYTFPDLNVDTFIFPDTDGSLDQFLRTDGGGNLSFATPAGLVTDLQDAYDGGNTIVTTAGNAIAFSNAVDVTDLLTLTRTFVGAGNAADIDMGPGNEAVTGDGLNIASGTGATGTMLFVNNLGSGNAIDVQDGGVSVLQATGAGAVGITPTSGQDFSVATLGAGGVDIDTSGGTGDIDITSGGVIDLSATTTVTANAYDFPAFVSDTFSFPDTNGAAGTVLTDVAGDGVLTFILNSAALVTYDNTATGIPATDVQAALDEALFDLNLVTGNLTGGLATVATNPAEFDVAAGEGYVLDITDPEFPEPVRVSYGPFSDEAIPDINTPFTSISIDINGNLVKRSGAFLTPQERRVEIPLQLMEHPGPVISNITNQTHLAYNVEQACVDQLLALGAVNTGNVYFANSTDLTVAKTIGTTRVIFINTRADSDNPNEAANAALAPATLVGLYQDGVGGFTQEAPTTIVNAAQYDDGSGTLTAVSPSNRFQIKRIYLVGASNNTAITYGQALYNSIEAAEAAIFSEAPILSPLLSDPELTFRSALIVRGTTADLSNTTNAKFVEITTAAAAAAAPPTPLQGAYDVGPAISVDATQGTIAISNATDVTDLMTLSRTFVGLGSAMVIDMGPGNEAVTDIGLDISSGTGATGTMLFVNNLGSGNALDVQDGGVSVLQVDGAGAASVNPTSGQDFNVATLGVGGVDIDTSGGTGAIDLTSGDTIDLSAATTVTANAYTFPAFVSDTFSFPNANGAAASVLTDVAGDGVLTFAALPAAGDLQDAYDLDAAILVDVGQGPVAISDMDATTLLTLDRDFVGAGGAISILMGEPGNEAVTGIGLSIVSGTGATGDMLFVNNQGSGDALDIQDGGVSVLQVTGAGAVAIDATAGQDILASVDGAAGAFEVDLVSTATFAVRDDGGATAVLSVDGAGALSVNPTSGQDFIIGTLGVGGVDIDTSGGTGAIDLTSGDTIDLSAATTVTANAYTFPAFVSDTFSFPNVNGAAGSVLTDVAGDGVLTFVSAGGGNNLQQAYDAAPAILVDATGPVAISNATTADDLMTLTRTFVGLGSALVIDMGPGNEAVTDLGLDISSGTGATGTMLQIDNLGSGDALDVRDGGTSVLRVIGAGGIVLDATAGQDILAEVDGAAAAFEIDLVSTATFAVRDDGGGTPALAVDGAGAVSANPTSGQDFIVGTLGVGGVDIDTSGGTGAIDLTSGDTIDLSATTTITANAYTFPAFVADTFSFPNTNGAAASVLTDAAGDGVLSFASTGDVVGPGSATDNAIARFDTTSGKLIQDSLVTVNDTGSIALPASETVDGRDVSVDGTKLDTVETSADVTDADNVAAAALLVNIQVGTTYTLANSDNGKLVTLNNGAGITVSLNTGLTAGFHCALAQLGAGQVTIAGTATLNHKDSHDKTEKQDAIVAIMYEGTTDAYLLGGATAA